MAPETPKGVSSRLLTMKFMQRAIASNSAAASPESETSSTKKRKLDHGSLAGRLSMDFDQASVDAAMHAQEATRKAALLQHATGDTHWVLNTNFEKTTTTNASKAPRKIVYVGYGDIDSANDSGDGEDVAAHGRTSTHKPKPKNEDSQKPSGDETGDETGDESGQDSDDSEDSNPRKRKEHSSQRDQSRSRSKSRTRLSAAEIKAKELRDKRRKKEVRLNNITSISGGSGTASRSNKSMTCYNCHQPGHMAADCPRRKPGGRRR